MEGSEVPATLAIAGRLEPALDDLDVVADFLADQTANTARAYDSDLRDFAAFVGAPTAVAGVSVLLSGGQAAANRVGLRYKIDLVQRGLKPNTVRRRLAALRSVVNLARRLGRVAWILDCPGPKAEVYRDTRGPGNAGWDAMRKVAAQDAVNGRPLAVRNRAMVRIAHDMALRVAELISLDLEHIDLNGIDSGAWVLGKGKKARERLTIPVNAALALAAWVALRGAEPGPLFIRLDNGAKGATRLSTLSVRNIVGILAKRAGIAKRMSPHKLRHHAITVSLERNNGNIFMTQKLSRHADANSLNAYIDTLADHFGEMANLISDED